MKEKKQAKKPRLFNIIITDEMAADIKALRKDGILISAVFRKTISDLVRRQKNGELFTN